MAGKEDKDKEVQKTFNPDERFKYLGFEIHPGKIGNIFKSDSERESWVEKVRQKRQTGVRVREHNTLEEARVTSFERVILTITSVLLIVSLFFPWFSGFREFEVETVAPAAAQPVTGMADSLIAEGMSESTPAASTVAEETAQAAPTKDEAGFTSVMAMAKRKEIRKEHESISALGALGVLGSHGGDIFSSGFVLILTAILMLLYILFCIGYAGYALYTLYAAKGNEDVRALQLKKTLRLAWIPILIYVVCIILSIIGAEYSFDTSTAAVKQIGTSYGTGVYLGLLSYGFYATLACFALNGAKGVEI